jgi:hypothetical protein
MGSERSYLVARIGFWSTVVLAFLLTACGRPGASQTPDVEERIRSMETGLPVLTARGMWLGATTTLAERMDACDRAVALAPDNAGIKDSRGLARALTGDYAGAVEDLQEYADWLEKRGGSEYELGQRRSWISELESGRNPFDEAVLMEMR